MDNRRTRPDHGPGDDDRDGPHDPVPSTEPVDAGRPPDGSWRTSGDVDPPGPALSGWNAEPSGPSPRLDDATAPSLAEAGPAAGAPLPPTTALPPTPEEPYGSAPTTVEPVVPLAGQTEVVETAELPPPPPRRWGPLVAVVVVLLAVIAGAFVVLGGDGGDDEEAGRTSGGLFELDEDGAEVGEGDASEPAGTGGDPAEGETSPDGVDGGEGQALDSPNDPNAPPVDADEGPNAPVQLDPSAAPGSRENPVPAGQTVEIGGWAITIVDSAGAGGGGTRTATVQVEWRGDGTGEPGDLVLRVADAVGVDHELGGAGCPAGSEQALERLAPLASGERTEVGLCWGVAGAPEPHALVAESADVADTRYLAF